MNPALELIEAINGTVASSGPSELGSSVYREASECGMRARLKQISGYAKQPFGTLLFKPDGKPRVIGARAGSAFHALMELWATSKLPPLPKTDDLLNYDFDAHAALRAFVRYQDENKGSLDYVGTALAAEQPVEGTVAGERLTGRLDNSRQVSEEQSLRWFEAPFNAIGPEPGLYLWDYKLLGAVSEFSAAKYARSVQGYAYMAVYEQQTGVRPAGMVYELVSRADKPKLSRLLVVVPNLPAHKPVLEHFVKIGNADLHAGVAKPGACDNQFGVCPFITICPRYGTFDDHPHLADMVRRVQIEDED